MSQGKNYTDDWNAFIAEQKAKSDYELEQYRKNLVSYAAGKLRGTDSKAQYLFEKLTYRAKLVQDILDERKRCGTYSLDKYRAEPTNERIKRLRDEFPDVLAGESNVRSDGATASDPPIPTKRSRLVPPDPFVRSFSYKQLLDAGVPRTICAKLFGLITDELNEPSGTPSTPLSCNESLCSQEFELDDQNRAPEEFRLDDEHCLPPDTAE
jgi:hypothetical protein